MTTYDRLSGLDSSFLHLEGPTSPMHVGSLAIFEGGAFFDETGRFRIEEARQVIGGRLDRVPRFRKKIMEVPFAQGRPIWVDDPEFDLAYHVRLTALPRPGNEEQLKTLMGRLQATPLDRRRPLWELWFVEGLEGDRVAIIQKTHHALVDGISGVDVATVILDLEPQPPPVEPTEWEPAPPPSSSQLLVDSLVERATQPAEIVRSVRAALRGPRRVGTTIARAGRFAVSVASPAPSTPLNVPVGPHRRFEVVRVDLDQVKAIKGALGGTVNDVVLTVVAGGMRHFLLARSERVEGLSLKTFVPVSVRDESERMLLGNKVAGIVVDLPVGEQDPVVRLRAITAQTRALKDSQQAVGAEALISLAEYAPPTLLSLAARLLPRQRSLNLGVTNVPGPQFPLYCMGARMIEAFPYVGVFASVAVVIAVLSYDGRLGFGLIGDRDAVPDLAALAEGIDKAVVELAQSG